MGIGDLYVSAGDMLCCLYSMAKLCDFLYNIRIVGFNISGFYDEVLSSACEGHRWLIESSLR